MRCPEKKETWNWGFENFCLDELSWADMIFFFSSMLTRRERERERECVCVDRTYRWCKFRFQRLSQRSEDGNRDSKCRGEELGAAKRTVAYQPVSSVLTGFSLLSILASQLRGRTSSAEWRQGRNNFSPCFSLLESHIFLMKSLSWVSGRPSPLKETKAVKKIFLQMIKSRSPPAALDAGKAFLIDLCERFKRPFWYHPHGNGPTDDDAERRNILPNIIFSVINEASDPASLCVSPIDLYCILFFQHS